VIIETGGEYEISLSRWHPAANSALEDSLEQPQGMGKAIPIAKARLRIGDVDLTRDTQAGQTEATFTVNLQAGKTLIETWFLDKDGNELCSAYYTKVKLK
jgi:hypothetical protein